MTVSWFILRIEGETQKANGWNMQKIQYEIRIKGQLDVEWAAWFNGLAVETVGEDETLISGELPDQSALHGLLAQILDRNLILLSVQRIENQE